MRIKIDEAGIGEATRMMMQYPGHFRKARIAALKSVGNLVRGHLRNHIEYGGEGWPGLHPLSLRFKTNKKGKWIRRGFTPSPLFALGKFARYLVDREGTEVQIDFFRSAQDDNDAENSTAPDLRAGVSKGTE